MTTKRFPIFYAADTGIEVPTVAHPPASTITEVTMPAPDLGKLDVHAALGVPEKPANIRGPQDIFGDEESPENATEQIERGLGKAPRERGPDGKFLPSDTNKQAKPQAKATPKPAAAKPSTTTQAPAPAPEPKIKIGDEEKTAAEWAAYHKELAEKAKKAEEQQPPASKTAEQEPTQSEDPAEQRKSQREAFIAEAMERYAPTQDEFDTMLANGDTKAFGRFLAGVEANIREAIVEIVQPHIDKLAETIEPMSKQQQELQQYQTENQFLDANPEIKAAIKADPTKIAIPRQLSQELFEELQDMKVLLERNPANARAKARAEAIENNFLGELATATKAKFGLAGTPPAAPATPSSPLPAPEAKRTPPAEKPLSGDRPGSASAGRTETPEQRLARELLEA